MNKKEFVSGATDRTKLVGEVLDRIREMAEKGDLDGVGIVVLSKESGMGTMHSYKSGYGEELVEAIRSLLKVVGEESLAN